MRGSGSRRVLSAIAVLLVVALIIGLGSTSWAQREVRGWVGLDTPTPTPIPGARATTGAGATPSATAPFSSIPTPIPVDTPAR